MVLLDQGKIFKIPISYIQYHIFPLFYEKISEYREFVFHDIFKYCIIRKIW